MQKSSFGDPRFGERRKPRSWEMPMTTTPTGAARDDIVKRLNEIYWAVEKDRTKDRALDLIRILTVRIESSRAPSPAALGEGEVDKELRIAQENLNRRFLNNNDQSAGRSARAITSALTLLTAMREERERLREACERCIELLETVEAKALVGDEGCLWPVELMRAALSQAQERRGKEE